MFCIPCAAANKGVIIPLKGPVNKRAISLLNIACFWFASVKEGISASPIAPAYFLTCASDCCNAKRFVFCLLSISSNAGESLIKASNSNSNVLL